jgi:hypothetical protein
MINNIEQCQEAFLKIDKINEKGEIKNLNPSVYILTNEKEEDQLLKENLELEDLEIQIDEVEKAEGYEGEGYEGEDYEGEDYEGEDYEGEDYNNN